MTLFGCGGSDDSEPGSGGSGGSAGSGGNAPACFDVGQSCAENENGCCNGSTCINNMDTPGICALNCENGSECNTGCCAPISDAAGSVCAPVEYCVACVGAGDSCAADVNSCCSDSVCVNNSLGIHCAALCSTGSQCNSGCCAPLDTGVTVCSPAQYCE